MKAVADTNDAQSDPDRAASALLMKAMKHGAVSSSIQEEHDFANAPSTRAMQGMNHEVAPETIENVTDLEKQPTSPFFRAVRGNGTPVSGLKAAEDTDKTVNNLDYENKQKNSHPYANGFYNGFGNAIVKGMEPTYRWTEYLNASQRPDRYTDHSPQETTETGSNKLFEWNGQINRQYDQNRHHENEPTAEAINRAAEKYSNLLGGVAGTSFLMAVQRNLTQSGATLFMSNGRE